MVETSSKDAATSLLIVLELGRHVGNVFSFRIGRVGSRCVVERKGRGFGSRCWVLKNFHFVVVVV